MKTRPNATLAAASSAIASLIVYLASLDHLTLPDWATAAIAGAVVTVVMFVGREGLRGALRALWTGAPVALTIDKKPAAPAVAAKKPTAPPRKRAAKAAAKPPEPQG